MFKVKSILVGLVATGVLTTTGTANAATYTVKSGDTLSEIAEVYGTTIEAIAAKNGIQNVNWIFVGDALNIDDNANSAISTNPVTLTSTPEVTETTPAVAPTTTVADTTPVVNNSGSVYDQFIANGGTDAMWQTIVLPESGGNPDAISPAGYRGLGQTMQAWGTGSVATQTAGMLNYATQRYGSIDGAVAFRIANGWW
ncbi:MAG: LysM peptidoglycan-binding domain-containing protein [Lactobacillaceae bacterium]|jgi:LysM repeat protein|nr:LysM peptidoglycan-binding domain-containing protein [Lactobacillaceae bacterium]